MLSMPSKYSSILKHFEIFFLFFPENRFWYFMQLDFMEENLQEMSKPFSWENNLLSAQFAQRVIKVKRLSLDI